MRSDLIATKDPLANAPKKLCSLERVDVVTTCLLIAHVQPCTPRRYVVAALRGLPRRCRIIRRPTCTSRCACVATSSCRSTARDYTTRDHTAGSLTDDDDRKSRSNAVATRGRVAVLPSATRLAVSQSCESASHCQHAFAAAGRVDRSAQSTVGSGRTDDAGSWNTCSSGTSSS